AARTAELDRIWRLSRDLMIVVGFDDVIRSTNPAWLALLGWEPAELIGMKYMKQVHPDDIERSVQEAQRIIAAASAAPFENRYRHKDGSYRSISWTSVPVGDLIHSIGRDVTAEREAEQALRQTEDALRQSQKMEAVGQLTGGIAHDFNNLLQGIVGSIEITRKLIGLGRATETEKFINGAMTSAQRAAALTHRLLAFSRRQPLDPKPLQINQLVVSMEDLLRRTVGVPTGRSVGVSIDIQLMLAANAWVTKCDSNQVENAILNLVINARDAMPDGGRITIRTSNGAGPRDQRANTSKEFLCISVMDEGTGMPPEVVARAFDPFFTTKPTGQGTGLGLSMIYGFAQQSNGFARIRSEVGKGTTVKLYLPRFLGMPEKDEAAVAAVPEHGALFDETILVIEDEQVVRDLAVRVLTDLRYRVIEAADGPAGLNILDSDERIDLVLTDIGLPGLNGRQVVDAARIKRPDLLVLFMTGYAENAAFADGFLEPGMGLITKPYSMDTLTRRIREMIAERGPADTLAR
ncbi:MAG: ATP-binding protein, partial [Betaproteobacteria bacterium]